MILGCSTVLRNKKGYERTPRKTKSPFRRVVAVGLLVSAILRMGKISFANKLLKADRSPPGCFGLAFRYADIRKL